MCFPKCFTIPHTHTHSSKMTHLAGNDISRHKLLFTAHIVMEAVCGLLLLLAPSSLVPKSEAGGSAQLALRVLGVWRLGAAKLCLDTASMHKRSLNVLSSRRTSKLVLHGWEQVVPANVLHFATRQHVLAASLLGYSAWQVLVAGVTGLPDGVLLAAVSAYHAVMAVLVNDRFT